MIKTICLIGECEKIIKKLDKVSTSRIKRSYKNSKLIIEKRSKELKRIKKEKMPNSSLERIQSKHAVISIKIEKAKCLKQATKIRNKKNISPENFLIIKMNEKNEENNFYSFLSELGWLVSLPAISEKYIQEIIATFFLNFEEEKNRKLKNFL